MVVGIGLLLSSPSLLFLKMILLQSPPRLIKQILRSVVRAVVLCLGGRGAENERNDEQEKTFHWTVPL